jgi:hypothetical protein
MIKILKAELRSLFFKTLYRWTAALDLNFALLMILVYLLQKIIIMGNLALESYLQLQYIQIKG